MEEYISLNDLSADVQTDIVENIYHNSPYLEKEWNIWTFKENIDDATDLPKLKIEYKNVDVLFEQMIRSGWDISEKQVDFLSDILKNKELDPVILNNGNFFDGGHRLSAYKMMGKKLIPTIDIGPMLKIDWEKWADGEVNAEAFRKIVRKTLFEYVTEPVSYLKKYLTMSDKDKFSDVAYNYCYKFNDFLIKKSDIDDELFDSGAFEELLDIEEPCEALEVAQQKHKEIFDEFVKYALDLSSSDQDAPAHQSLDFENIVKNQWLVHMTDDADAIAMEGFKYGTYQPEEVAYTKQYGKEHKKGGGYNFAYTIDDFKKYARDRGGYKYGKEAIVFRASGIRAWHHGDEEPQTIFWGETAKNIVPVKEDYDGNWAVKNKKNDRTIYSSEKLDNVVDWIVKNYDLYRGVLGENTIIRESDKKSKPEIYIAEPGKLVYRSENKKGGHYFAFDKNDALGYLNFGGKIVSKNIGGKKFVFKKEIEDGGFFFADIVKDHPELFNVENDGLWDEFIMKFPENVYFDNIHPLLAEKGFAGIFTGKKLSLDYEIYVF